MPLLKDGEIVEDSWTSLAEESDATPEGKFIVTLEQWQEGRERLRTTAAWACV